MSTSGVQGHYDSSGGVALSGNGRYVAFAVNADNLFPNDNNQADDIVVHDRVTHTTEAASINTDGDLSNGNSYAPSISADGRFVAFNSLGTNLAVPENNSFCNSDACMGVFVRDRLGGVTLRVSMNSAGEEANFGSDSPDISEDGRYVAFASGASNLVADDTNGQRDVFVHDVVTGATTRVSVDGSGVEANSQSTMPSISADGQFVAFESSATNLVPGGTSSPNNIFIHDRVSGSTERVTLGYSGDEPNRASYGASVSADGRFVAFFSGASNLVTGDTSTCVSEPVSGIDVFVRDTVNQTTIRASLNSMGEQANNCSWWPEISGSGRYVTFGSDASNLVQGDTNGAGDAFVHDLITGETTRVSVGSGGAQANGYVGEPHIDANGEAVAFTDTASNLVSGDTNNATDVFVHYGFAGSSSCEVDTPGCISGFWAGTFDTSALGDCSLSLLQTGAQIANISGSASCTVAGNGTVGGTFNQSTRQLNASIAFIQPAYAVGLTATLSPDENTLSGSWTCACGSGAFSLSKIASRTSAPIAAASGGTLATSVGDTLTVPAGALAADTTLTSIVQPVPAPAPAGLVAIAHGYQFGPDGTTFSTPITAVFNYTDADLGGGLLDPSTLRVYVYDTIGQQWQLLGGTVDTVANTITVSLDHFSQYALFGNMPAAIDGDGDAVANSVDNCVSISNQSQVNTDAANTAANRPGADALGDACDNDKDGDGYTSAQEAAVAPAKSDLVYCEIMRADVDGDGAVSILDLSRVAHEYLKPVTPTIERLNQDADTVISILDLSRMASRYLQNVSACP